MSDPGPGPNFPANAFAGTASYYAKYRVPYPRALFDDLRKRAGITGTGRLLDLGCGPGRVALPLAPFFSEVWAVDREPEMIEVGRKIAEENGITNVRWTAGRAEDLEIEDGTLELITCGESFHRLDQKLIASRALEWLPPGRCLATMGCSNVWWGREKWHLVLDKVVDRVVRGADSKREDAGKQTAVEVQERVLAASGFADVASYTFQVPYTWTLDSLIGFMYSTSIASKRALGEKAERFESEVWRDLLALDPGGKYPDTLDFGYTLARRPLE